MNNKAFKVGIVSFLLVSAITVLLVWKSGIMLRAQGTQLYGSFGTINGLLNGAEVRYRGYKIGQVFAIDPQPKEILVKFRVKEGVKIPKGSKLTVVFDGLVGEKYLGIKPNYDATEMVKDGDTLYGKASLGLASFVDIGAKNLQTSKEILDTFNSIFSEEDVANSIKNGLLQIEQIAKKLNKITEDIGSFSEEKAISNMVSNFKYISDQLRHASETMFVENNMAHNLAVISENLASLTTKVDVIAEGMNDSVLNEENLKNIDETIDNISEITGHLNRIFNGGTENDASNEQSSNSAGKSTSSVVTKATNMFNTISAVRVTGESKFEYSVLEKTSYFDIAMDVRLPKNFFRLGLGNRLGTTQFFNLQHGVQLNPSLVARYGLFFTQPGIGFDYQLADPLSLSLDLYDPNNLQAELHSRLSVFEKLGLLVGLRSNADYTKYNNYSVGVSYSM